MKMHEYKALGADARCQHCGLSEEEGSHSLELEGTPAKFPKRFMSMRLDRAKIGLRMCLPDDPRFAVGEAWGEITYPGIPIARLVRLREGHVAHHRAACLYEGDLINYLGAHGVEARWID